MGSRLAEHRAFLVALAAGVLVRVVTMVAFPPAFVFSDGPTYLAISRDLAPSPDRTVGYSLWLAVLHVLGDPVWLVALSQHVLGVLMASLTYLLLRRWGVAGAAATLGVLPLLLDGMQLSLEHSVLSDIVFMTLLVVAISLLAWWRSPRLWAVGLAGVVLGLAVVVRVAGEPTVVAALVFVLIASTGWRARMVGSVLVVVGFALPLLSYAAWYHAENGSWTLTEASGRALYMRTTTFLDCSLLDLADYEQKLCPTEPVGERLDPTYYGWHAPARFEPPFPPQGTTLEQSMGELARKAIAAQPEDYALVVGRDLVLSFDPLREDRFEYDTAHKWHFSGWYDYEPTSFTAPAYDAFGGTRPSTVSPWAELLVGYGSVVYLWGPLQLALLVLAVVGLLRRRPVGDRQLRALVLLLTSMGVGLVLVPDATAEFTWRYVLPMVVLVPPAAALAWTRLRAPGTGELSPGPARRPGSTDRTVA